MLLPQCCEWRCCWPKIEQKHVSRVDIYTSIHHSLSWQCSAIVLFVIKLINLAYIMLIQHYSSKVRGNGDDVVFLGKLQLHEGVIRGKGTQPSHKTRGPGQSLIQQGVFSQGRDTQPSCKKEGSTWSSSKCYCLDHQCTAPLPLQNKNCKTAFHTQGRPLLQLDTPQGYWSTCTARYVV